MVKLNYIIENNEVTVISPIDFSVKIIDIPKYIDALQVTTIRDDCFCFTEEVTNINILDSVININPFDFLYLRNLEYINNIDFKTAFNIVNNRFIYHYKCIFTIRYQINDDYCCPDGTYRNWVFFIDDECYNEEFINLPKINFL